ncbi:amino acid permease-domain-containing protein [Xylaria digitata]|nr:amino acid permease-domain-containing protein [Xylaria digitata]
MLSEHHVNMVSFSQCEMAALFPVKGPIIEFPRRFLDESLGYGAGWLAWYFSWVILISAKLVAITHIFQFEYPPELLAEANYPDPTLEFHPRVKYIFGLIKMLFIILMIVLNVAPQIRRPAGKEALWTYNDPYYFKSNNLTLPSGFVATGGPAQLGASVNSLNSCLFGLIGFETIAITAAENRDLRTEETVNIGTRKIALRIILLYSLATFTVGFNVPYAYSQIVENKIISFGYGQNCVFVISPLGANGIYNASRTLHALASIPEVWPELRPVQTVRRRLQRISYGVPHAAVLFSAAFGMLGFLAVNDNSQLILGRLVRLPVASKQAAVEGLDKNIDNKDDPGVRRLRDRQNPQYPYRSHGQWLRAVYALFGCSVLVLFNGWRTFSPPFSGGDFVACYIGNPRNWQRGATNELQIPRPEIATSVLRRGQLALVDTDNLFIWQNAKIFGRWLWVWMR